MKIIIGLGNPGRRYEATRHNVGFKVALSLADKWNIKVNSKAFKSFVGRGAICGEPVIIALPQNYMNNSGEAVRSILSRKRIRPKDLLVICDDVNLRLGVIRIRAKGSAGGHNGLKSIIEHLGSGDFSRLRVGIGKHAADKDLSGYVLSAFGRDEAEALRDTLQMALDCCEAWVRQGTEGAARLFNKTKVCSQD